MLFNAGKPRTNAVKQFLAEHNLNISECVLVGDRPFDRCVVRKNLGCKTILVDSITADTESKLVRCVRSLERVTIRR